MSLIGTRCLLCSCISNLKLMLSEKFSIVGHVPFVLKMDTFDNELVWNSELGECCHFNHLCYHYRRCRGRRFSSNLELGKSFQSFLHPLPSNHIYFIFRARAFNGLPSLINILPLSFFAPNRYQRNDLQHTKNKATHTKHSLNWRTGTIYFRQQVLKKRKFLKNSLQNEHCWTIEIGCACRIRTLKMTPSF